ncbi:L,D-transpeptidase family protein [Peptostreptococcus anaerobius]|uniref:L,D-transpeptidase family protein n=1 Tax=Peptostreptococcus porci TaxID=2652282 RepID=A0A6N7XF29_9FIRM|nr:cell wall-binding repeat-containing protein [Peptostreptococcus porci]MST61964.1 L,D-transpeptidase family protein [Peptostreptococcus porci]
MKRLLKKSVILAVFSLTVGFGTTSIAQDVSVKNISGADRFSTAVSISQNGWKNGSENVIIVNANAVADSLSVAPFASEINAPVLLSNSANLDVESTVKEISRLHPKNIYIIGGENSISSGIEESLKGSGYAVERISGNSRVETSINIAKKIKAVRGTNFEESFVVNGVTGLPDAAGAGAVAAKQHIPIIFTDNNSYANVSGEINGLGISKVYLIGGTNGLPEQYDSLVGNVERISGVDRQDTNLKIIKRFFGDFDTVYIAEDGMGNNSKLIDSVLINAGIISSINSADGGSSLSYGPVLLINSNYGFTFDQLDALNGSNSKVSNLVQVSGGVKIEKNISKIADFIINRGNQNSDMAFDKIMKYRNMEIEYSFEGNSKKLTGKNILPMIEIDKANGYQLDFNRESIKNFLGSIKFNGTVSNNNGSYAYWKNNNVVISSESRMNLDVNKETDRLIDLLKKGESVYSVTPYYTTASIPNKATNIGNKYVVVNIKEQNMKLYENGKVTLSTPIVSGNPNRGMATPPGIFTLRSKARNVVLRGPGYASPVQYWMPFNGSIGIHDAYWQPKFGGTRYLFAGSHGCINTPLNKVSSLYSKISVGTPVIVVRY